MQGSPSIGVTTAPAPPVARPPRLQSLTGIRALGAVLVFGGHCLPVFEGTRLEWLARPFRTGIVGVSWFFMLSGFVLTWSDSADVPVRTFYRRRIARLWPAHLAVLAVLAVIFLIDGTPIEPGPWIASLFLVEAWFPDASYYFGANGVAWSLSCEVFFYALTPLLIPAIGSLSVLGRRLLLVTCGSCSLLIATLLPHPDLTFESTNAWLSYILPAGRLPEFVAGIALAHECRAGRWRWMRARTALAIGVLSLIAGAYLPLAYSVAVVGFVPFLLVLAALARSDAAGTPSVLGRRWLVAGGERAYSFYLVHTIVVIEVNTLIGDVGGPTTRALVVVSVAFVVTCALAWLLHRTVEVPAERRLRRPRRTAPVAAA